MMCGITLQLFCPRCGTTSEPRLLFCGDCGAKLKEPEESLSNKVKPAKASFGFFEKWVKELESIGWGQDIYEQRIRKRLKEQTQLEEGEAMVFAASSGGWLIWVQSADDTEAGVAHAIAGTNRRLIIWTSRAPDFKLSRFREIRYGDLKEVRELTELRIGQNVQQFDGLISISFREKDEALGILVGRTATAPLLGFLKAASNTQITVAVDSFLGGGGLVDSHGEGRDMAQKSLLQMLEELASKVRLLEREKREAVARIQALERENSGLTSLISLASEKVDEILKGGANDEISQPQAVNVPAGSKGLEQLGEFSADKQRELKERSHRVFRPE
jgi:hypothetical protein